MERENEIILIGPAYSIRPSQQARLSNQKSNSPNGIKLGFAPGAISVVFEGDLEESLANGGFNRDELRTAAGQPGGGK